MDDGWLPWRHAWDHALYGPDGFYRHASPSQHFRTSGHVSPLFALAIVQLAHRLGLHAVIDLGAGSGELAAHIAKIAPDVAVTAVDIRPRPSSLPDRVTWCRELSEPVEGLLLANELLDNVPCDVVERADDGVVRIVEVQPATGFERLGPAASDEVVAWLDRWWQLPGTGQRAEVGLERDLFWKRHCAMVISGASLAIDYGHLADYRPAVSTLRSYQKGRETELSLDGLHDVSAHVAIDSLAEVSGGTISRQREMLRDLGVTGSRPDMALSATDPIGYLRALSASSEAAELMQSPGLGDFHWVLSQL